MAPSSPNEPASAQASPQSGLVERVTEVVKPYLAPYYLTVAALLGAITVGFAVVMVLLVLVVTNFNVLGWME